MSIGPASAPTPAHCTAAVQTLQAGRGVFALLDTFSIIDATGADAVGFLHHQLTHDIQNLDQDQMRRAGLCSPKGRLLATFYLWKERNRVRLMTSADVQASVQQRLSMFILRSKVKLADARARSICIGLAGDVSSCLTTLFSSVPDATERKVEHAAGVLIRLPDSSEAAAQRFFATPTQAARARYLWIAPRAMQDTAQRTLHSMLAQISPEAWDWLTLQTGEPWITAATQTQFVPQMINFELIGGVSFRKGCYPGQEIVARMQYRGAIKRRMWLARTPHAYAGASVFHSLDPDQPCGTVVNAAHAPDGETDCLVELKLSAVQRGVIHLHAPDGPPLILCTLPYQVPEIAVRG